MTVDGIDLAATVWPGAAGQRRPGLLFLHGMHSDQGGYQERARAVVEELGLTCLTLDLGGHGESGGDLTRLTPRDHIEQVTAAYDVLAGQPTVDPDAIGVCGASYGAFLASILAGRRPVSKLLLRAPGLYGDDMLDRFLGPPVHSEAVPSPATRSLRGYGGDTLIVESGADEVIPPEVIAAYLAACPRARRVAIPGAAHALTDAVWRRRFLDEILGFFDDRPAGTRRTVGRSAASPEPVPAAPGRHRAAG